jgi:hypothetical protein
MRTRPVLAAVTTAAVAALTASALAAPTATTIDSITRSTSGTGTAALTTAAATGTAIFDGRAGRGDLGGAVTPFAQANVAQAAGTDLKAGFIEELADGSGLRFTWKVSALPAQVPPEGVRYAFAFQAGDAVYQLQAKRTNVVTTNLADDPQGHVTNSAAGGAFNIRGRCGNLAPVPEAPTNVSTCPSLAFLKGGFNIAAGEVFVDLPYGTSFAPEVKEGVVLREAQIAGMSIAASFQAGVSNVPSSQFINGWAPYYTGPFVGLALGTATAPATYAPAVLTGSTWSGTASTRTSTKPTTLHVRTCEGATSTCTTTSKELPAA